MDREREGGHTPSRCSQNGPASPGPTPEGGLSISAKSRCCGPLGIQMCRMKARLAKGPSKAMFNYPGSPVPWRDGWNFSVHPHVYISDHHVPGS